MHTATHLLLQSLKEVLKQDIKQMGSNITPERTRFDFSFPRALTKEEIRKVEDKVNEIIEKDLKVTMMEMPFKEAMKKGVNAFFSEKYPEVVSVYYVGDFSREVCTGPHVTHTGTMGHFKIIKEECIEMLILKVLAQFI